MKEEENVLRILKEARVAVKGQDSAKLRQLSNQTNNTAARTHDPDNIAVAVIVYALSKVIEREHYQKYPGWEKFYKNVLVYFDKAIYSMKKKDEAGTRQALESIRKEIGNLSGSLKKYIQDVFRKAQINKASKIYEHGISMEKTAKLLGITLWELANYAGQSPGLESPKKGIDVKERIKLAMEILG